MLRDQIKKLVEEKITGTECFLVDVKVSPSKVMVFIDKADGIKIEDCVSVSRFLQETLETEGVWESHELEVSSPGMDEPLKVLPQYQKRIGREVSVITFDGLKHTGILEAATEDGIELNETVVRKEKGKKEKIKQSIHLPFTQIKETKVAFSFDRN